ncbi:MAG TPA: flagellar biosynthesis protein FlgB [Clostridia bacterium]|nr:flagellar biosynthesis protein FlgB [Clostridia bacterium]
MNDASMTSTPMMQVLSKFLDVTAYRQTLIAGNMANVNTPGYRTLDIDFRNELHRAMASEEEVSSFAKPVAGLIERPDGNNVSLDREGLMMAHNQLQFRAGVALLRSEFRRVASAINEGR